MKKEKIDAYVACDSTVFTGSTGEADCTKHDIEVINNALKNLGNNAMIVSIDKTGYIYNIEPKVDRVPCLPEYDNVYVYIRNHDGLDAINILFGYWAELDNFGNDARYFTKDDIGQVTILRFVDDYIWRRDQYHLFERVLFLSNQATRIYKYMDKHLGTNLGEIQTVRSV